MNAGELNQLVTVLKLVSDGDAGWSWSAQKTIWAKVKQDGGQGKMNLFSRVGLGAKTELFTMRVGSYTLHHALRWRGKHYFITDIRELEDRRFCMVETAAIEPIICVAERPVFGTDALKRPVALEPVRVCFPACAMEKYLGWEQKKPMAVNETAYVIVTPKAVQLRSGDLVRMSPCPDEAAPGSTKMGENSVLPQKPAYTVTVCHVLDEYKNEYEVTRQADV